MRLDPMGCPLGLKFEHVINVPIFRNTRNFTSPPNPFQSTILNQVGVNQGLCTSWFPHVMIIHPLITDQCSVCRLKTGEDQRIAEVKSSQSTIFWGHPSQQFPQLTVTATEFAQFYFSSLETSCKYRMSWVNFGWFKVWEKFAWATL